MLTDADLVAFAASTDLDAAQAFYGGVLGLELGGPGRSQVLHAGFEAFDGEPDGAAAGKA